MSRKPAKSDIGVLIVDDQNLMREGLRTLLELEKGIVVVGEAADGRGAVEAYASRKPRVVLMDIKMPVMDGVEATRRIRSTDPDARILMLTTFDEDALVFEAIRAGARGYLLKDVSGEKLADAVRDVAKGGAALPPQLTRRVVDAFAKLAPKPAGGGGGLVEPLSSRERSVLDLLAAGLSNKEIAVRLCLAEGTVKNHVSSVLRKMGERDRTRAALAARERGLLEPPRRS